MPFNNLSLLSGCYGSGWAWWKEWSNGCKSTKCHWCILPTLLTASGLRRCGGCCAKFVGTIDIFAVTLLVSWVCLEVTSIAGVAVRKARVFTYTVYELVVHLIIILLWYCINLSYKPAAELLKISRDIWTIYEPKYIYFLWHVNSQSVCSCKFSR